jgi:hypothetical protein
MKDKYMVRKENIKMIPPSKIKFYVDIKNEDSC